MRKQQVSLDLVLVDKDDVQGGMLPGLILRAQLDDRVWQVASSIMDENGRVDRVAISNLLEDLRKNMLVYEGYKKA